MEQSELLLYVTELLERLGIEHMLVGSIASVAYGESRFTLDIDIVVDLDQAKVRSCWTSTTFFYPHPIHLVAAQIE